MIRWKSDEGFMGGGARNILARRGAKNVYIERK